MATPPVRTAHEHDGDPAGCAPVRRGRERAAQRLRAAS